VGVDTNVLALRLTNPPVAPVTTLEFGGFAANQSDRSTFWLYSDEELSLKCNVTSPIISMPPGALFCVVKPRMAMLVKIAGLDSANVPVGFTRSRLSPPYVPRPNVNVFDPDVYDNTPD
jgi:hypothetical protein